MMERKLFHALFVIVAVTVLCFCAASADDKPGGKTGADAWDDSRLGRVQLGRVLSGPEVTVKDLRGKVVLLEFWGYRCPPSLRFIPHLSKLNKTHARKGLVVIGAHAQRATKTEVISTARSNGSNYTIVAGAGVPDANFKYIPHVFIFNHKGKVVYEGSPGRKMDKAVLSALKRRPHPLLGERKYKAMLGAAAKIKAGRLGEAWKQCVEKKDAEGDAGDEAGFLLANLERYAKRLFDTADKQQKEAPSRCVSALEKIKRQFAGAPHAEKAVKKLKELAGDKDFQTELKADKQYVLLVRAAESIPPCPEDKGKVKKWKRKHGSKIKRIRTRVKRLKKQYPDTRAADKAEMLLTELTGED